MNRKLLTAMTVLLIAAFGLAACGGDDDSADTSTSAETSTEETTTDAAAGGSGGSGGGKGGTIEVVADPSGGLEYTTGELTVDSGAVEVEFDNPASLGHDVQIESETGETVGGTEVISESSTSTEVELEPGTYTYYCSVGSHRPAGMEATLIVK